MGRRDRARARPSGRELRDGRRERRSGDHRDPGVPTSRLREVAGALRERDAQTSVAEVLITVARSALGGGWAAGECAELAVEVFATPAVRLRAPPARPACATDGSERRRQQHALCTYKDLELPLARRLDEALKILEEAGRRASTSAETLGIAGAIYKRRWEVDAGRTDLESASCCYRRGFDREDDDNRWYAGVNAAFAADQLAALEETLGGADRAEELRVEADWIRSQIVDGRRAERRMERRDARRGAVRAGRLRRGA